MQVISKEPGRLMGELSRIQREILDASVTHYRVFNTAHEANALAVHSLATALTSATQLHTSLSKLQAVSGSLVAIGESWRRDQKDATSAVTQHPKVLELLEAPQTLEVCIRSELYHEALLVVEHVAAIAKEHGDIRLIRRLASDMDDTMVRLIGKVILPRLSTALNTSVAVKLTTFLRRLGVPESRLRLIFLQKRGEYVDGLMKEVISLSHSPYSLLSKVATVFKVHVCETVNQYAACFTTPTTATSSSSSTSATKSNENAAAAATTMCSELSCWCQQRSSDLISLFEAKAQGIHNGSEVASLIEQCTNEALSTSKIALDVTPILTEILLARIGQLFCAQIATASQSYVAAMSSFVRKAPMSPGLAVRSSAAADGAAAAAAPVVSYAAPVSLLQFLPLSYALNGILSACNEVRKCPAQSISPLCLNEVAKLLKFVLRDVKLMAEEYATLDAGEQSAVKAYLDAFLNDFVPHVVKCLDKLFPANCLAHRVLVEQLEDDMNALKLATN